MSINIARRYYLLKSFAARDAGDVGQSSAWLSKHNTEPGTALSATFPGKTLLEAAGYTAIEDIRGADAAELSSEAGLTRQDAEAAITAAG